MKNNWIKSYCKINLFLIVNKKKENEDLHKITSVFKLHKGLFDEISINISSKDKITYLDKNNKTITIKNCILRKTLDFLRNKFFIKNNYDIKVKKNIPIGSGLGGASSDAATLIRYICNTENINYKNILKESYVIGSDVPFFLSGYDIALVREYGNDVKKIKSLNIKYEILISNLSCSTKDVYNEFDKFRHFKKNKRKSYILQLFYLRFKRYNKLINDLEKPCFSLYKKMYNIKDKINSKYHVMLSGSGSTLILFKK